MARRLNKNKLINTKNLYIKYNSDNSYELCLIEKTGKGKSRSLSDTISPIIVYTNNYKVFSFKKFITLFNSSLYSVYTFLLIQGAKQIPIE